MADATFLTHVTLTNYKSIAHYSVALRPLMFLVGPNGAGKSNFLDALRFVADALSHSLEYAINQRSNVFDVLRFTPQGEKEFSIHLDFQLPSGATGTYAFRIAAFPLTNYKVVNEECRIHQHDNAAEAAYYQVENGVVTTSEGIAPPVSPTRLYLVNAAGLPAFAPVYEALAHMAFYNLSPDHMRDYQIRSQGGTLLRDGSNIAGVIRNLQARSPATKRRMEEYLAAIVPGIARIDTVEAGRQEIVGFEQQTTEGDHIRQFLAYTMSDGTLRALGILATLYQEGDEGAGKIPLIGIEEPETALHPAAVGALLGAMDEASLGKQIIVTTHSDDLLDDKRITAEMLLAVVAEEGGTRIGPLDRAGQYALQKHLYTSSSSR